MTFKMLVVTIIIGIVSVIIALFAHKSSSSNSFNLTSVYPSDSTAKPVCLQNLKSSQFTDCIDNNDYSMINSRIVVVGDVHGSYDGLLEILFRAGIIHDPMSCNWNDVDPASANTTLIQIGDIVDRGTGASEAWHCLKHLQQTASEHNKVVRMIGNHELWWMSGYFHMRNTKTDTKEKVIDLVVGMKEEITNQLVVGAHSAIINGRSILFTHSGIRPEFFKYLEKRTNNSAYDIAAYINSDLAKETSKCMGLARCEFNGELYDSGPDRGGDAIGGPYWTDFRILAKADSSGQLPADILQIVGHTASSCAYEDEDCIRHTESKSAICVDGGMYLGSRSYLELLNTGQIIAYEKKRGNEWKSQTILEKCEPNRIT